MSFNWSEYLHLAEYTKQNPGQIPVEEEAVLRSSVSRAYYAALCTTRNYIQQTDGVTFGGGDTHMKVRKHLKESGNTLKRKIANQLEGLHLNRKKADYDNHLREKPKNMAAKTIAKAKEILGQIKELSGDTIPKSL
ncbi:MAG: hypothetical protein GY795_29905 [Desulfobacterales bacterium]|nr:hypothetical protein [Desulfobacterales bacterium]